MKLSKIDIIFSLISGLSVSWIAFDLLSKYAGKFAWYFFIILPVISVFAIVVADFIGKKILFVKQAAKFSLAGAFADVVDIKVFQILFWIAPFSISWKIVSFFAGTFVKYWSDKYWSFENRNKKSIHKEIAMFFVVALLGSLINVVSFYFFGKIKTGLPFSIWQEICIILAAVTAAAWNFCGYKFLVFKK